MHLLVRTVAKGGNLEINFGPTGDGHLAASMTAPLLGTGRWLGVNGAAIYGTRGFPFGTSIAECSADTANTTRVEKCYTVKGTTVYVIYMRWPQRADTTAPPGQARAIYLEHVVPTTATTVTLLSGNRGQGAALKHTYAGSRRRMKTAGAFVIHVPAFAPDTLGCDIDLCHSFVFAVSNVSLTPY